MNSKRVIGLNLTFGTAVLAIAVLFGVGGRFVVDATVKSSLENLVNEVVSEEKRYLELKHHYIYFSPTDPDRTNGLKELSYEITLDRYTVEAFPISSTGLVVRAYPTADAIKDHKATVVLYEHRIGIAGEKGTGTWLVEP